MEEGARGEKEKVGGGRKMKGKERQRQGDKGGNEKRWRRRESVERKRKGKTMEERVTVKI